MIKHILIALFTTFLFLSCAGDKSKKPTTNQGNKVNPIKKETAKTTQNSKTTKSSSNKREASEGASPEQLAKASQILDEVDSPEIDVVDSKKLFKIHCSVCHGFNGDMQINGAKNLVKSRISIEEAVAQVYHGKGLMTPYKGVLTDAEIIAVSQYTETLRR